MPYFIFAVKPFGQLEPLGQHAVFRDASAAAKTLRAERAGRAGEAVRVMFAESASAAEDLLLQVREPLPPGDD
jgi:hypothetical protein